MLLLVIGKGAPYHELLMTVFSMKLCVLSRARETGTIERVPEGLVADLNLTGYSSEHGEFKNELTKKQVRAFSELSNACKSRSF